MRANFKRFARRGDQHAFRLKDGQNREGWIMAVGGDALVFAWAPSPFYAQAMGTEEMSPPDETIPLGDIDMGSLSYWDEDAGCWSRFDVR